MKTTFKLLLAILITWSSNTSITAQTPIPICAQTGGFSGNVRGYYFTAPATFTICGVFVEDDMSTAFQAASIVRFTAGAPPAFAGTTNNFVTLFQDLNHVPNTMIPIPNIVINAGDIIGVYGARSAGTVNSYGPANCVINIQGIPTTTFRSGMQFSLAAGPGMHDIWSENTGSIGRITMFTNCCPTPPPIAAITGDTTVCEGDTATYTIPAQPLATAYNWTVPVGATINSGQGTTSLSVTWNASPGGNICADWTDTCSASNPTCLAVTVNPTSIAPTVNDVLICTGDTVTLTATAPGPIYNWFDAAIGGTLFFSGASYTTPALIADTSYWVQSTIGGCVGPRAQVNIGVGPGFTANAGLDVNICFGDTANLAVSPNSTGNTYNWSEPGMATIGTLANQAVTPIITTTYTIEVIDSFGCVATDDVIVNVNPIPVITVPPNLSYCAGDIVPASVYSSVPAGSTYNWFHTNTAVGLTPASGTSNTPEFTATNTTLFPDTTIVSVFPTLNGCTGDTASYLIIVNPTPFASIIPSIVTGKPPLIVSFDNGSAVNNNYDWDFGNGETSSLFLPPNATYENSGTYLVNLVVTDPITGCTSSNQVTIEVEGELVVMIPTIFTPNGDGLNDIFSPVLENFESYSMKIYNRWGTSVFETNSLENGWDGSRNGSELSEGAYFFLIEYSYFEKGELKSNTAKGSVTLFK